MKKVTISLKSLAPYYQSRMHGEPGLPKERPDAREERTWREKCTVDDDGNVMIPPAAIKSALTRAAQMLGMQIVGRGKSTYVKHFKAGLMVPNGISLPIKKSEIGRIAVNCHSGGKPTDSTRVVRFFPEVKKWEGKVDVIVLDETITPEIFEKHAKEAGLLVGIGQNRPENGGASGRFTCEKFVWSEIG